MEAARSSESSTSTYQSLRLYFPEGLNLQHLQCTVLHPECSSFTSTLDEDTVSVTISRHRCAGIHPSQHTQNTNYGLLLGVNPRCYVGWRTRESFFSSFTFYIMSSGTLIHPNGLDPLTIRAENTGWDLLWDQSFLFSSILSAIPHPIFLSLQDIIHVSVRRHRRSELKNWISSHT